MDLRLSDINTLPNRLRYQDEELVLIDDLRHTPILLLAKLRLT